MNIRFPLCRSAGVLSLALCAAMPVMAQESNSSGFYVGFSAGQTKFDAASTESGLFDTLTSSDLDDTDMALGLVGGYRLNRYFGIEASLSDLGDLIRQETGFVNQPGGAPAVAGVADFSASAKGPALALTATLPMNKFEFFIKAGAMYLETNIDIRASAFSGNLGVTLTGGERSESTEMLFGAGIGYVVAEDFFFKIEWVRIPDAGDEDETGEEIDLNIIGAGFQYRF